MGFLRNLFGKKQPVSTSTTSEQVKHTQSPPLTDAAPSHVSNSKAAQVRKIFKDFAAKPNSQLIDQLNALIMNSDDPEVTTAILETFEFQTSNLGVFGLALQSLGFVYDPRAVVTPKSWTRKCLCLF